jgi:hypothetical protein
MSYLDYFGLRSVHDEDVQVLLLGRGSPSNEHCAQSRDERDMDMDMDMDMERILRKEPSIWAKRLIRALRETPHFCEVRHCEP